VKVRNLPPEKKTSRSETRFFRVSTGPMRYRYATLFLRKRKRFRFPAY